jgi:hypothetical protein
MPMSRLKRVGLSLACAFVSELIVAIFVTVTDKSGLNGMAAPLIGFSIFVLPGWALSLPPVLVFDSVEGWRFWFLGAYGVLIGPTIILVWAVACKVTEGSCDLYFFSRIGAIASVIALLSTSFYLAILTRHIHKSGSPQS